MKRLAAAVMAMVTPKRTKLGFHTQQDRADTKDNKNSESSSELMMSSSIMVAAAGNSITIHACAESGDLRGVKRLLRYQPSLLNKRIITTLETPLHISAKHNRIKVMEYLLYANGQVQLELELEAKNHLCETPLHVAAKEGCDDAVWMLLQHGANIEARTNNYMTPLHLAVVYAVQSGNNSTVKALLENYADLSAANQEGMIPIDYLPENTLNTELETLLNQGDAETRKQNVREQIYYDNEDGHGNREGNEEDKSHGTTDEEDDDKRGNCKADEGDENRGTKDEDGGDKRSKFNEDEGDENRGTKHGDNNDDERNECSGKEDKQVGSRHGTNDDRQITSDVPETRCTSNDLIKECNTGGQLGEFVKELEKIIGLHNLKIKLLRWAKGVILDDKRRAMGLNLGPRKRPHMAFLGNPGTGKTTVARILGKLLHSTGVLSRETVTEVQRTDLVGEYIGQTGPKTREKIREAMGGILFVDEAYRLSSHVGTNDFGLEALEEIMSVLEDKDIVVIFAGYTEPMKRMLHSNPGFYRRVTHYLQFEDYSCKDLAEMLLLKMSKQDETSRLCGFKLHEPTCNYESILSLIESGSTEIMRGKMNGGLVDHMLNNARENLDSRLRFDCEARDDLCTITLGDLEAGLRVLAERTKADDDSLMTT